MSKMNNENINHQQLLAPEGKFCYTPNLEDKLSSLLDHYRLQPRNSPFLRMEQTSSRHLIRGMEELIDPSEFSSVFYQEPQEICFVPVANCQPLTVTLPQLPCLLGSIVELKLRSNRLESQKNQFIGNLWQLNEELQRDNRKLALTVQGLAEQIESANSGGSKIQKFRQQFEQEYRSIRNAYQVKQKQMQALKQFLDQKYQYSVLETKALRAELQQEQQALRESESRRQQLQARLSQSQIQLAESERKAANSQSSLEQKQRDITKLRAALLQIQILAKQHRLFVYQ